MTFTVKQAKSKWCPFVQLFCDSSGQIFENRSPHINRDKPDSSEHTCCIANSCMVWKPTGKNLGYCGLIGDLDC